MKNQKTINESISFSGIGLHSGVSVNIYLKSAKENTGIIFKRIDLSGNNEIQALYSNVSNTMLGTTISNSSRATVKTIEHFMAAIWACDIDNMLIEIDNEEIPIMDGSSTLFIDEIKKAGIKELNAKRNILKIKKEVIIKEEDKFIKLSPYNSFNIESTVDFNYGNIGVQKINFSGSQEDFIKKFSIARTFCNKKEIDYMRSIGLAKGGSLDNAMVFDDNGIINEGGFKCENEVGNHKVLDCVGDMFTAGYYIEGKIETYKPGHGINNAVLRELFSNDSNYEFIPPVKKQKANREIFFNRKTDFITLENLLKLVNGIISKDSDMQLKITDINTLKNASKSEISFLTNEKYIFDLEKTSAGFCFIKQNIAIKLNNSTVGIIVKNPHYAYTQLLNYFYSVPIFENNGMISEKAYIDSSAVIGDNVEIQAGAYIDKNVTIGNGSKICANSVIYHDVKIGDNCFIGANATISYSIIGDNTIIQNGSQIGQCGYGFAHNDFFNHKIPQLGLVKIGNNVEIQANVTIDRGAFDDTIIGDNTKIDNMVHIAHGVEIGRGCFLAGQAGIAGSTKIGNFVQIGGQSGVSGHLKIADAVQISGHSGVIQNIEKPMTIVAGYPSMNIKDWHRDTVLRKKAVDKNKNNNKK